MSGTDPGPLPTSKMELAVTIINDSPIYAKSPVLVRRRPDLSSTFINHLYYPHYCYSVKSPALAIMLLSLLYLFASKSGKIYYPHYCYPVRSPALAIILLNLLYLFASRPGKICTLNFIDSFWITSFPVVCSEFNHSPFTIMVRVKGIIFNYFEFYQTRLISKRMKYIGSLFILVFVYSKVSPKHFLRVFKNRGRTSLPILNPHL